MKYSVPTNWQDELIDGLMPAEGSELYGQLNNDIIGGGRASALLPFVSEKTARRHINIAHQKGFRFNYLLNATCLGNFRYLESHGNKIKRLLNWLVSAGVDAVTASSSPIVNLVRKYAPGLDIYVSVQENINNEFQIKHWDEMGVDKITLSVLDLNRNFALLRKIKGKIRCDLQLIANLKCLLGCHAYHCHGNLNAHSSQSGHRLKGYLIDYYTLKCNYIRFRNPEEFIKSPWIRPEDVHYYEEIGIHWLKLVGREMESGKIQQIFKAYKNRRYDGNLLDLFPGTEKKLVDFKKVARHLRYFFRPQHVNILKLSQVRDIFKKDGIYIDNRSLDGFLEYFWLEKCNLICGSQCDYCKKVTQKAIVIKQEYLKERIKNSETFLDSLINGSLFDGYC